MIAVVRAVFGALICLLLCACYELPTQRHHRVGHSGSLLYFSDFFIHTKLLDGIKRLHVTKIDQFGAYIEIQQDVVPQVKYVSNGFVAKIMNEKGSFVIYCSVIISLNCRSVVRFEDRFYKEYFISTYNDIIYVIFNNKNDFELNSYDLEGNLIKREILSNDLIFRAMNGFMVSEYGVYISRIKLPSKNGGVECGGISYFEFNKSSGSRGRAIIENCSVNSYFSIHHIFRSKQRILFGGWVSPEFQFGSCIYDYDIFSHNLERICSDKDEAVLLRSFVLPEGDSDRVLVIGFENKSFFVSEILDGHFIKKKAINTNFTQDQRIEVDYKKHENEISRYRRIDRGQ